MKVKMIFAASAALLLAALPAAAQNLDPTVTVTRAYKGAVGDGDKPVAEMFVPDSVTKFNIQFDYSIKPRSYNGSYEFSPYLLEMKPKAAENQVGKFFVKLGAGYSMRPTFTAVWSPIFEKADRFKLNVYANHDSYEGKYRDIGYVLDPSSANYGKIYDTGADMWNCYDMFSKGGVEGRLDFDESYFAFDANYTGLHTKTDSLTKGYNSARVYLKFASKDKPLYSMLWDAELRYHYGHHDLDHALDGKCKLNEHNLAFNAFAGANVEQRMAVLMNADLNFVYYGGFVRPTDAGITGMYAGNIAFTPRYTFNDGCWDISAGVRFDIPLSPKDGYINTSRGQIAYPDVRISVNAVPKYLAIYLKALGGMNLNTFSELLESNHFFSYKSRIGTGTLIDNTVERVNASLGFRGQAGYRFRYDLSAGYVLYASAPLDAFALYNTVFDAEGAINSFGGFTRGMVNVPYQMYYVKLKWGVKTEPVAIDSYIRWQDTDILKRSTKAFEPARFLAGLRAEYNWRKRVFAGLTVEGAIARRGLLTDKLVETSMPGYVNLCVDAGYRFNRVFSMWVEGSNLCNQVIQKTAFYAERGADVRAGLTLNF